MTGDDRLLADALHRALAPPAAEPPAEHLAILRLAVADRAWPPFHAPRRHVRRSAWAGVAALVAIGGSAVGAAAAGSPLPTPLRDVATAVGLPVDDSGLAAAKAREARLRDALRRNDTASVQSAATALQSSLNRLDRGDRASVEVSATALLHQAGAAGLPATDRPGPTTAPPTPATTVPPAAHKDPTPATVIPTTVPHPDGGHHGQPGGPAPTTAPDSGQDTGASPSTTTIPAPTTTTTPPPVGSADPASPDGTSGAGATAAGATAAGATASSTPPTTTAAPTTPTTASPAI